MSLKGVVWQAKLNLPLPVMRIALIRVLDVSMIVWMLILCVNRRVAGLFFYQIQVAVIFILVFVVCCHLRELCSTAYKQWRCISRFDVSSAILYRRIGVR